MSFAMQLHHKYKNGFLKNEQVIDEPEVHRVLPHEDMTAFYIVGK